MNDIDNDNKQPKKGRPKGSGNKRKKIKYVEKYSEDVLKRVLSYIANGTSVDELHRQDPNVYPSSTRVGLMIEEDDEFSLRVDKARKVLSHRLIEKLHDLQANPPKPEDHTHTDAITGVSKFNKTLFKIDYDVWCKRLKSVESEIKELNNIYNSKYTKQSKVDTTVSEVQTVHIINYADYMAQQELARDIVSSLPDPDKSH